MITFRQPIRAACYIAIIAFAFCAPLASARNASDVKAELQTALVSAAHRKDCNRPSIYCH